VRVLKAIPSLDEPASEAIVPGVASAKLRQNVRDGAQKVRPHRSIDIECAFNLAGDYPTERLLKDLFPIQMSSRAFRYQPRNKPDQLRPQAANGRLQFSFRGFLERAANLGRCFQV
jgi:hypothetical protein